MRNRFVNTDVQFVFYFCLYFFACSLEICFLILLQSWQRELGAVLLDFVAQRFHLLGKGRRMHGSLEVDQLRSTGGSNLLGQLKSPMNEADHIVHVRLRKSTRRQCWRAQSDARRVERRFVSGNGVLVARNRNLFENVFGTGSGDLYVAQVDQHQMHIGAARRNRIATGDQSVAQFLRILHHLSLVFDEFGRFCLSHGSRDTGNCVVVWTALKTGEYGCVDLRLQVIHNLVAVGLDTTNAFAEENHTSSGTAQCLVCGCRYNVAVLEWTGNYTGRNQTTDVCHIREQVGSVLVGNRSEALVVQTTRVARHTGDDDAWLEELSVSFEDIVVDETRVSVHLVRHALEEDGSGRDFLGLRKESVRQMAAVGQIEAHDASVRLADGRQHGKVGRRSRVWLDIDAPFLGIQVVGFERPLLTQDLDLIDVLVTAIVALRLRMVRCTHILFIILFCIYC